jgi:hypothetical protein
MNIWNVIGILMLGTTIIGGFAHMARDVWNAGFIDWAYSFLIGFVLTVIMFIAVVLITI